jgi:predicted transcriptional regulator
MLQTNAFYYSPEIRDIVIYIFKKKRAKITEIGNEFINKVIHGQKMNSFIISTILSELERIEVIKKREDGNYEVTKLPDLIFAQILTTEICHLSPKELSVSEYEIKDIMELKYGISFSDFENYFNRLRRLSIPNLIIPGSYGNISINKNVAKEVNLL